MLKTLIASSATSNQASATASASDACPDRDETGAMSPAEKLAATIVAAVGVFSNTRADTLDYTETTVLLNASWEVLNAVPTLVESDRETDLQNISLKLDKLWRATGELANTRPDVVAGRGAEAKRKMDVLKLYTTSTLTAGQIDEYSALQIMPEGEERDARIEAFRSELDEAGIEAALTTGEETGPGSLIEPRETGVYDIHYNYEYEVDVVRVYGSRACHRDLYEAFIGGYYVPEDECMSQDEIDAGSERFWASINSACAESRDWVDYSVTRVEDT